MTSTIGYGQVVSFGHSGTSDLEGGYLSYVDQKSNFGGMITINGNSNYKGYFGALGLYELIPRSRNANLYIGAGFEIDQTYRPTDYINSYFGNRSVLDHTEIKPKGLIGLRWKFLNTFVSYGAPGINYGFGFILNR